MKFDSFASNKRRKFGNFFLLAFFFNKGGSFAERREGARHYIEGKKPIFRTVPERVHREFNWNVLRRTWPSLESG